MNWLYLVSGFLIIAFTWVDVAWTTLTLDGGGPVARRLTSVMGKLQRSPHMLHSPLRTKFGASVIIANVFCWVALLWLGWWLVYMSDPNSVVASKNEVPANAVDRIYFVGFLLTTLGTGDFVANGSGWRVLAAVAAATGLVMITLSLTYFIPVLSAAIQQRKTSVFLAALGSSPQEILLQGWDGQGFPSLLSRFDDMSQDLMEVSRQHAAYPVLNHFLAHEHRASLALNAARLAEAHLLLRLAVQPSVRPSAERLRPLGVALCDYFNALDEPHSVEDQNTPPVPDLEPLREAGIPTVPPDEFARAIASLACERRLARDCVRRDGWEWKQLSDSGGVPGWGDDAFSASSSPTLQYEARG